MKRLISLSLALLLVATSVLAQGKFNYTDQWKNIDKLMDGILPQSALPEIEKVYQAALKDKSWGQLIKAVMTRNTCLQMTSENPQVTVIHQLRKDAETTPFPAKAVIYSLTGEAFLNYYNNNRWKMHERTALAEEKDSDDIETWDAARLIREVIRFYRLSLRDPVLLQKIGIGDFKEALEGDDATRYLRPTLYDFLAHRAIDVFSTYDLWIVDYSDARVMDNPAYFADAQGFAQLTIPATDTLAPTYLTLKLLQELTAFRLTQNDINPLADVNLKRFTYLKDRGNFDDMDDLYEGAMKNLMETCAGQKIWGKVAYTLAIYYKQKGEGRVSLKNSGQSKSALVEAVNLCREIEKQASLKDDRKLATEMIKELSQPDAMIVIEKNIIPHAPALIMVTYKNLHTAYLNIYRYQPEELQEFFRSEDVKTDAPKYLAKQEKIATHTIQLPEQHDYQRHSFETKLNTLPAGSYLLVVSDKPDPAKDKLSVLTYHPVQATRIKLLQRRLAGGNVEAYTVDALSGKPLAEAQIDVIQQMYDREQSNSLEQTLYTDSCGIAVIPFTQRQGQVKLQVSYGGEMMNENLMSLYGRDKQTKTVTRTLFFTDRAIYRPGQTVHFKGLLYETDNDGSYKIQPKSKTFAQLMDVNGKEVARQEFTTNEYGSFSGFFTLPKGSLNGRMTIRNEHGEKIFFMEEYKRPTFEVIMNPVTADYVLGDTVTMTGTAKALSGYAVDGAKVAFNVMRHEQYRTFKRTTIYPPRGDNRHIASGTVYTDGKGLFTVRFPAKAEDIKTDDKGIYRYQMAVDVTDSNGETQGNMQEVQLSRTPLLIDCQVPEKIMAGSDSMKYTLNTTNLNGTAVAADVQVEVYALRNPGRLLRDRLWQQPDTFVMTHDDFTALFPNDPYADEDQPATYARESTLASFQINTQKERKLNLGMMKNAPSGWYLIKFQTSGNQKSKIKNQKLTDSIYVQLQHPDAPIMNMKEWITVVKNSGEPGDTAVYRVAGQADSSVVRYDVLFKDKVIERKFVTVGRVPQVLRFPIREEWRGGFAVNFAMVAGNREYTSLQEVKVPYTNKKLDITFTSFRGQLLPGEKEKWTLTVKNKKGGREAAEMVATLYDASLDHYRQPNWMTDFYPNRSHNQYQWEQQYGLLSDVRDMIMRDYRYAWNYQLDYERLKQENWGDMRVKSMRTASSEGIYERKATTYQDAPPPPPPPPGYIEGYSDIESELAEMEITPVVFAGEDAGIRQNSYESNLTAIPLRSNFSETAFFYPELRTNEKGEMLVEFTIPEALTRWNMLGFAHTKDFKTGHIENNLITQKQVAISANLPRFFRTGDTLLLSAKVNNLTEGDLTGNALLRLYDAFTMQPVDAQMLKTTGTQPFTVKTGQSAVVRWKLVVPANLQAVTYRLSAQAGKHTDGEERSVPVLTNRMLVTETMPFMVRGDQRKDFRFDKLAESNSGTLRHHRVTLEYTSNPAWYAVQALPYLMDYPYECAEQVFSRFYANTLATTVANSAPKIKQIFNQWRSLPDSKSLLSNLEKNQDLKQALLEETPWVAQANNETERKKRIGVLFDLNRMAGEQKKALDRLKAMQGGNGGFPWFAGQPEDRFVTQHILAGLEHLRNLNALPRTDDINSMIERAMEYCDARIAEDYQNILKKKEERAARSDVANRERRQIDRTQLHYLYACSFSKHYPPGQTQAFDFYMQLAEKYWAHFNVYEQAMTALVMYRFGKPDIAQNILRSLKERAQVSDDMGMYWADNRHGYFWNESPVETQAMLIEAFNEAGSDIRAVGEMKIWLLRNKQTTDWQTTKATSEAVYALLSTDDELLGDTNEPLDIRISGKPLIKVIKEPLRPEAGTGYVRTSWSGDDISKSLATLRITNPNSNIAWGALYWQYFEDADKITSAETNLRMTKQLFIKRSTDKGKVLEPLTSANRPKVGDVVTVRLELRADRDFEYVHLKDMRAAGFEPASTLSGYRFQGGLGYYESIRDASTNFFISYLRKGTYVFEFELRVSHAGDFSNGITTFQCMYAPEFNAHSEGGRVKMRNDE